MSEQAPVLTETTDLRYLDPRKLRFFFCEATLRLQIADECSVLKVAVVRAFPLSQPHQYLSIRDGVNKEVGLVVNAAELDDESQRLMAEELERRYMVPVIRMKERFGTVNWEVETD